MAKVVLSDSVRFTPAQRDALLRVAARLQAEQEATVNAEELTRAALEAGIDPRFLGEAAALLEREAPRPETHVPLVAWAGLALFDFLFLGIVVRHWFFPVAPLLRLPILFVAAYVFSLRFGRHPALRPVAPLAVLPIWVGIGATSLLYLRFTHQRLSISWEVFATCAAVQALGALAASAVTSFQNQGRR